MVNLSKRMICLQLYFSSLISASYLPVLNCSKLSLRSFNLQDTLVSFTASHTRCLQWHPLNLRLTAPLHSVEWGGEHWQAWEGEGGWGVSCAKSQVQQRALISLLSAFSGALSPAGEGEWGGWGEEGAGGHSPSRLCHQSVRKTLSMQNVLSRGAGAGWGKNGEGASDPASKKDVNSSQLVCKNWHKWSPNSASKRRKAGSTWRRGKHTESGSHVVNKCGSGAQPPFLPPSLHPSIHPHCKCHSNPKLWEADANEERETTTGGRRGQNQRGGAQEMSTEEGEEEREGESFAVLRLDP